MSEPESLDTDEALERRVARHHFDRLIMLCDGTYAIAITLAALEIHLPEAAPTLAEAWGEVRMQVMSYIVSFAVIAVSWFGNRDLFARLHHVDRMLTLLVLASLCFVALIPASTHLVYAPHVNVAAFQGYALTMVIVGLFSCAGWIYAILRPGLMFAEVPRGYRWRRAVGAATMPLLFAMPLFFPGIMGIRLLLVAVVVMVLVRRVLIPRLFG